MIHNIVTEVDSLDHIHNQILWKGFLTTDPKRVNITRNNSKKILYIHQLFDKTDYLSVLFWTGVMDQTIDFIRFIGVVKSQYKQDLHCSGYKEKTAPQLRRRVLQDFTFPRLVFIWAVWSIILKVNVQNTMKDQQT